VYLLQRGNEGMSTCSATASASANSSAECIGWMRDVGFSVYIYFFDRDEFDDG